MKRALIAPIALAFAFAACSGPSGTTPGASGSPFALTSGSPAATTAASPIASASGGAQGSPAASASAGAVTGSSPSPAVTASAGAVGSPAASAPTGGALSSAAPTSSAAASAGAATSSSSSQCVSALQSGQAGTSAVTVDVGTLVDRSDAESVIGTLTGTPARIDLPVTGFIVSACVYSSADGSMAVALGPNNLSKADFENLMKLMPNATSLSGVGDSAFAIKVTPTAGLTGAASIFVHSGNTYFTLQATSRSKSSDSLLSSLQTVAEKASKKF